MTGFGNSHHRSADADVAVEIKAVNNRYLKLSLRLPDVVARYEADIEKIVRERIARGSVQVSFRVRLDAHSVGYGLDGSVIRHYLQQAADLQQAHPNSGAGIELRDVLQLPGVVIESECSADAQKAVWPALQTTLKDALDHFDDFRRSEGESMKQDLELQCQTIASAADTVELQAPNVVSEYRGKLLERLRKAIGDADVAVDDRDVIREVALYADRCDINEEITRLRSHIDQFRRFLNSDTSMGRKLEFLGQEMFREINTIGSKANNVAIAHHVVDMKAAIERIREVLQNVE